MLGGKVRVGMCVAVGALAVAGPVMAGIPSGSDPAGKSGPLIYRSFTTGFAGSGSGTATCPGKTKVTGGGADLQGGNTADAALTSAAPAFDTTGVSAKRGFTARGSVTGIGQDLEIFAICTKQKGLHYSVVNQAFAPNQFTTGVARCPRKEALVGGGFYSKTGQDEAQVTAPFDSGDKDSRPDDGWTASFVSGSVSGDTKITAICSRALTPKYVSASSNPSMGEITKSVQCPGEASVSGGGAAITGESGAFLHQTAPADISDTDTVPGDGWIATGQVNSGSRTLTVYAICLK